METLFSNKKFIKLATVLLGLLCVMAFISVVGDLRGVVFGKEHKDIQNTISVSADGEALAVPDIANLSLTITKDAKTAKEAQSLVNDMTEKSVGYLKKQKIEDKDIKSEYGGVTPKYDYGQVVCMAYPCPTKSPTVVGYTAMQTITVKVRDVDNANTVRTGLTSIGITEISGPTFSIDDDEVLKEQARAQAIAKAKEKAERLAKELGVRLGKVVSFSEGSGSYPIMYGKAMDMAVSSGTPERAPELPKGEQKVSVNVTISYEIR